MATKINDFAAAARLWQTVGPVSTEETNLVSEPVDMIEGDGPAFAILSVGEDAANAVISGGLEASDNGTTWFAVDGAEFPPQSGPGVRAITFSRPGRYLRGTIVISESNGPIALNLLIGQSRKLP